MWGISFWCLMISEKIWFLRIFSSQGGNSRTSVFKSHEVFEVSWSLMKCLQVYWSLAKSLEVSWSLLKSREVSWSPLKSFEGFWSLEVLRSAVSPLLITLSHRSAMRGIFLDFSIFLRIKNQLKIWLALFSPIQVYKGKCSWDCDVYQRLMLSIYLST